MFLQSFWGILAAIVCGIIVWAVFVWLITIIGFAVSLLILTLLFGICIIVLISL